MASLANFFLAFVFSFVGSIPPGTINLTLIRLGFEKKTWAAFKFALAASVVEYPYAWIAVKFEKLILSSPQISDNLHVIAAVTMIALGVINLLPTLRKTSEKPDLSQSGFRKGLLIGILNPLAIPYWLAITAFLRSEALVTDLNGFALHAYLGGVFLGAFALLAILILLSQKLISSLSSVSLLKKLPGIILLVLGLISLFRYFTTF
jgi:threonine/homoserine/homoserine lactone efflux protein